MTLAAGYVYDFDPEVELGPSKGGRHPGLIVGVSQGTPLPLSTSAPRGPDRAHGYELTEAGDVLSTPIWVYCHLPYTFSAERVKKGKCRGRLPHVAMGPAKDRMAHYLRLPLA
ncbi:MAG: hypothetical protein RLP09_41770 [Sandaracinaceae bacterium]